MTSRPKQVFLTAAGIVLTALALASCASPPDQTGDPQPSTSTALPSTSSTAAPTTSTDNRPDAPSSDPLDFAGRGNVGTLLGLSTGLSRAERGPRWDQLQRDANRSYDIGHVFHAWDKAIPTVDDLKHIDEDRLLMISWNGTDTKEIAAGKHDEWIEQQADAVRDLQRPVLLRWLWEMDGIRRRDWVYSGPDYVAAWNHIRAIFTERGATNALFVWCPNEFLFQDGSDPEPWYPGDDNVDWLCADGYNWADTTESDEWIGLTEIFGDFYAWAEPKGKPIMIGETGVAEAEPGAKAAWFASLAESIEADMPEIDALVYFDKDFTEFGHPDWRVDTSEQSYAAWLELSADPWFNPLQPN